MYIFNSSEGAMWNFINAYETWSVRLFLCRSSRNKNKEKNKNYWYISGLNMYVTHVQGFEYVN